MHFCVGAALARTEARIALRTLIDNTDWFSVADLQWLRASSCGATSAWSWYSTDYSGSRSSGFSTSSMLTSLKVITRTCLTKRAGRYMSHTQASARRSSK